MLTRQQTEQLLDEILDTRSEVDEAECKSGVDDALRHALCARLVACTSVEATQALNQMVNNGLLTLHSTRGGAYYALPETVPKSQPTRFNATLSNEDIVLMLARQRGSIRRRDVVEALHCDAKTASNLLLRLKRQGRLQQHGVKKGARYSLPEE